MGAGLFLANDKYYVSTKIGMSGCPSGYSGAFCKHQITIKESLPVLDASDRENPFVIATGNKNVPDGFFGLQSNNTVDHSHVAVETSTTKPECIPNKHIVKGAELKQRICDVSERLCLFMESQKSLKLR